MAAEQVPKAVQMAPDLVSIAAGGNDILRPGTDPDALAEVFDDCVASLRAAGCRVLLFTGFDPSAFPVIRMLRGKVAAYNMHLRTIAAARDCDLVDLWSMRVLCDRRVWSADRLHLNAEGHQRVALFAGEVAGVPVAGNWRDPLPDVPRPGQIPRPVASAAAVAAAEASAVSLAVTRLRTRLQDARRCLRTQPGLDERARPGHSLGGGVRDALGPAPAAGPVLRVTGVPPKRPELMPLERWAVRRPGGVRVRVSSYFSLTDVVRARSGAKPSRWELSP